MRRAAAALITSLVWLLVSVTLGSAATFIYARHNGLHVLSVQTGSMRPTLRPGDAVLVRQGSGASPGMIISYRSLANPKVIITHRVVAVDQQTGHIITKGDALQETDSPIGADRLVGRVERVIPVIGYDLDLLRRPAGLAAAVYLPAIVLIYGEVQRLMRYYDSQRYRLYAYPW